MYYIVMTDECMSGWGESEGKTNKVVIECSTHEEADIVMKNALSRPEMAYVHIRSTRPKYSDQYPDSKFLISFHTRLTYPKWFIPNYFKSQEDSN